MVFNGVKIALATTLSSKSISAQKQHLCRTFQRGKSKCTSCCLLPTGEQGHEAREGARAVQDVRGNSDDAP